MNNPITAEKTLTVGVDVGDLHTQICVLDQAGEVVEEARVPTTAAALELRFCGPERLRVVMEAGTHSPWVSRLLLRQGHEVIVANPRKLRLIYENESKSDRVDAEYLARVGRLDPALLSPLEHRSQETQEDLALIRSRKTLLRARTQLINHVRGTVKSLGCRLPGCAAFAFARKVEAALPEGLRPALLPVLAAIEGLSREIRTLQVRIALAAKERYPETALLRQVGGVGTVTALSYRLTIEDPGRFAKCRWVASYVGLCPRTRDSGSSSPQLRITKAGDGDLRCLLVSAAHYILGPFGPDCDLRRWGLALAAKGGKNAKKRAAVAVARKLSVLLLRLWQTGETYEPLRMSSRRGTTDPGLVTTTG